MDPLITEIINKKRNLIKGLEENIFKDFTPEDELLLHSKHGKIKVESCGIVTEGITPAFAKGLGILIYNDRGLTTYPKVVSIDWNNHIFYDEDEDLYYFEFLPINLNSTIYE